MEQDLLIHFSLFPHHFIVAIGAIRHPSPNWGKVGDRVKALGPGIFLNLVIGLKISKFTDINCL